MHAVYQQRLDAFRRQHLLRNERALAAYAVKVGVAAVARHASVPEDAVEEVVRRFEEVAAQTCQVSPQLFATGLSQAESTLSRSTVQELRPRTRSFPASYRIPSYPVTAETDQGEIGSCVGWGGAHGVEPVIADALGDSSFRANPSQLYGCIKARTGSKKHGATLEDLATVLTHDGVAHWESMPVHRTAPEGNPGNLPLPSAALQDAATRRMDGVFWINEWDADETRAILMGAYGSSPARPLPLIIGAALFESLFNAQTAQDGFVPMPLEDEADKLAGYHCMAVIGWREVAGELYLIVKNSWGPRFGDEGVLYFPFQYVQKHFFTAFACHRLVDEKVPGQPKVEAARPAHWFVPALAILIFAALLAIHFLLPGEIAASLSVAPAKAAPSEEETTSLAQATAPPETPMPNDLRYPDPFETYAQIIRLIEHQEEAPSR